MLTILGFILFFIGFCYNRQAMFCLAFLLDSLYIWHYGLAHAGTYHPMAVALWPVFFLSLFTLEKARRERVRQGLD